MKTFADFRLYPNSGVVVKTGKGWDSLNPYNSSIDEYITNIESDMNNNLWFFGNGILIYNDKGVVLPSENQVNKSTINPILFPNPASEIVYIKYYAISTNINIQVLDLEGRLIINKNIETWNKNSISISTKNLSSGVYIVSIKNNNTITNRKLIISK